MLSAITLIEVPGSDAALREALHRADFPTDDIEDEGRTFWAHRGVEDPAAVVGTDIEIQRAFAQATRFLKNRSGALLSLPLSSIDKFALEQKLRQIGQIERATSSSQERASDVRV